MDDRYIFHLKKPCEHRNVSLVNNGDGSVSLDGVRMETMKEVEDYIESKTRLDLECR